MAVSEVVTGIPFTIQESARRKRHISIRVLPGGMVVVSVPQGQRAQAALAVARREAWIVRAQTRVRTQKAVPATRGVAREAVREQVRALVHERLAHFNQYYQYAIGRVSVKFTKRMWGSCSIRGNLNFNASLIHLPAALQDYIVVHELCHLKEHNHSERFWHLVGETLPNYRALRRELRRYRMSA